MTPSSIPRFSISDLRFPCPFRRPGTGLRSPTFDLQQTYTKKPMLLLEGHVLPTLIRTGDLRMKRKPLQSDALPTELLRDTLFQKVRKMLFCNCPRWRLRLSSVDYTSPSSLALLPLVFRSMLNGRRTVRSKSAVVVKVGQFTDVVWPVIYTIQRAKYFVETQETYPL